MGGRIGCTTEKKLHNIFKNPVRSSLPQVGLGSVQDICISITSGLSECLKGSGSQSMFASSEADRLFILQDLFSCEEGTGITTSSSKEDQTSCVD